VSRPRIRSLKPELWADEKVGDLSIGARLTMVGLVTMADDEGRLRALPAAILGHVFPYDDHSPAKIRGWIEEIESQGIVLRYEHGGKPYMAFRHWRRHQRIDSPRESVIPEPPDPVVVRDNQPKDKGSKRERSKIDRGSIQEDPIPPARGRVRSDPIPSDLSVDQLLAKLRECDRFTVDDISTRVQVENAIGSYPDLDHMAAARESVIWATDPAWRNTNAGGVFLAALRKQSERKPRPGSEKLGPSEWDDLARELEEKERNAA
jgi:hypothetical protein